MTTLVPSQPDLGSDKVHVQDGVWPPRPAEFPDLMSPVEAAQYLRLDQTGRHRPKDAIRALDYFRDHGWLRATRYARLVWYRKAELDRFLENKTEGNGDDN